ncbi:hypothetical protein CC78DRAFT_511770 [Lojkania enalia]|uniref:Uncharacterized protein n=1 Tax=Lojkania enalia TaxID=147567 RepID=A0A9P4KE97_9PLEO|nr:hypothetical protein CC78DRAFT_511770 [Didymosphaeria enalia]
MHTNASSHSVAIQSSRTLSTSSRKFRIRARSSLSPLTTVTRVPRWPVSLFKDPQPSSVFLTSSHHLEYWYHPWLHGQIANMSEVMRQLKVGSEMLLEGNGFEKVFAAVAKFVRDSEGISIDDIVEYLRETESIENTPEVFGAQRLLVFAILGWQSMLYRPAFNTCTLSELAIHEDGDEHSSRLVFQTNRISAELCDRPLFIVLKGFGNLLPSSISSATPTASENNKLAATSIPLNPVETNAYLLRTLLHVKIRWVDCVALHLDYDKSSKTLSLFRFPSFCAAMLESKGTVFSFASTEKKSFDPRANAQEIVQLMQEVLLSFRLLFGQDERSRNKTFAEIFSPLQSPKVYDELLPKLCMDKKFSLGSRRIYDRKVYFAPQHFPVLAERIELIARELRSSRPNSIRDILRDRRDTLQYWTFWLVSIIGGISIILSLIQVILQGIQLAKG